MNKALGWWGPFVIPSPAAAVTEAAWSRCELTAWLLSRGPCRDLTETQVREIPGTPSVGGVRADT